MKEENRRRVSAIVGSVGDGCRRVMRCLQKPVTLYDLGLKTQRSEDYGSSGAFLTNANPGSLFDSQTT